MGKLSNFLKNNGIKLYTPKGWYILAKKTLQFSKKNKGNVLNAIRKKLETQSYSEFSCLMHSYDQLRTESETKQHELGKLAESISSLQRQYTFSAIIVANEGGERLNKAIWDFRKQIYPVKEIVLCDEKDTQKSLLSETDKEDKFIFAKTLSEAVRAASGDYVLFLTENDRVSRTLLFELSFELNRAKKAFAAVYTDHDVVLKDGNFSEPYYKPAFSPDLFLANDYICGCAAFRRDLLEKVSPDYEAADLSLFLYDLLLQVSEKGEIGNVARVLMHKEKEACLEHYSPARDAIRRKTLERRGEDAEVTVNEYFNTSIERKICGEPFVSVIIPTCYSQDYLEKCILSVYERSTYKNFEIIVADNSRKHPNFGKKHLKKFLKEGKCRIVYVNEPFNWSRLNNLAAKEAKGDFFLFLNDDTEVVTPDWMERMISEAQRPEIGEVGALLLYDDGRVQHAGAFMVDHGGGARHMYQFQKENCKEYHDFLHYRRECTYLTGACIMVSRQKFDAIKGFDETFAVVGNDLDFALRLSEAGYRNLYLPDVKLLHKEKVSRKDEGEKEGDKLVWKRWGTKLNEGDPYFNVNLDRYNATPMPDFSPVKQMFTGSPTIVPSIIKKILIVKLDHIGDNVIDLPAVRKVKKLFPNARIDILCAPWVKNFWEAQPEVECVIAYAFFTERSQNGLSSEKERERRNVLKKLSAEHYDLAIHLRRHEDTHRIAVESGADFCLAYSEDAEHRDVSHAVPALTDYAGVKPRWSMHDQMMALVNHLEYDPTLEGPIVVPAEAKAAADAFVKSTPQFSAPIVVGIHAGAGGDFRQWGVRNYGLLCNLILKYTEASVVLFGGKDEIPINEGILEHVSDKSRIVSVAGTNSLLEFCEMVKHVDYFVGNNSGPKHIAGMQGVPTLSIDGSSGDQEWSAPGPVHMTVRRLTNCNPCYKTFRNECPFERLCLDRLGAGEVWRGLERLMLLYPKKAEENNG